MVKLKVHAGAVARILARDSRDRPLERNLGSGGEMAHRVDLTDRSRAKDLPGREGSGRHRDRREDCDELATTKPGAGWWGNFRGRLHRFLDIGKEPKAIDLGISGDLVRRRRSIASDREALRRPWESSSTRVVVIVK